MGAGTRAWHGGGCRRAGRGIVVFERRGDLRTHTQCRPSARLLVKPWRFRHHGKGTGDMRMRVRLFRFGRRLCEPSLRRSDTECRIGTRSKPIVTRAWPGAILARDGAATLHCRTHAVNRCARRECLQSFPVRLLTSFVDVGDRFMLVDLAYGRHRPTVLMRRG